MADASRADRSEGRVRCVVLGRGGKRTETLADDERFRHLLAARNAHVADKPRDINREVGNAEIGAHSNDVDV